MAAFALQPHVVEFLDVVMHDETLEVRMEQVEIVARSPLADRSLREAAFQETTGALLLAIRLGAGPFLPNPPFDPAWSPESSSSQSAPGLSSGVARLRGRPLS